MVLRHFSTSLDIGFLIVADIAREECKKLYEKRLAGLEEELAALYRTLEEHTHRM
jgi:hypothetical protein